MNIGSNVNGLDIRGNSITSGTIENVINFTGVAIIKISDDRLGYTEAYLNDLEEKK